MELKECINYLLSVSQNKVFQEMQVRLKQFDITPVQYGVLRCLWDGHKNTPKEISDELMLSSATVSSILDRMEKKSLIIRSIDENDRRFIRILLTESGEALKEPVLDVVDKVNIELLAVIPEDERDILKKNLATLAGL